MLHICQSMLHWVTISNITKQTAEKHQQGRGIARLLILSHKSETVMAHSLDSCLTLRVMLRSVDEEGL